MHWFKSVLIKIYDILALVDYFIEFKNVHKSQRLNLNKTKFKIKTNLYLDLHGLKINIKISTMILINFDYYNSYTFKKILINKVQLQ